MALLRVLLLEDNPLDAELITATLADGGYDVDVRRVDTPEAFRAALDLGGFDIILADYSLPRFEGLAALRLAREHAPHSPFLFVSGRLGEELAIETLKSGATDYVLKHRLDRLVPSVQRALREAEERAERLRAERALAEVQQQLAEQLADMTRLHELSVRLSTSLELAPVLDEVLAAVTSLHGSDSGVLLLYDTARQNLTLVAARGVSDHFHKAMRELTSEERPGGAAFARRRRVVLEDTEQDNEFPGFSERVRREGIRAAHSVPLLTRHGEAIGAISVYFHEPHRPSDREARLVDLYAHQAAEAIDNARLYREVQEAGRRKDEFLAMLGHELRNPLAPIRNALQILRLRGEDAPTREWVRQVMDRQVTHLTRLVDDLLDVSRITRGKVLLRSQRCDLAALVRSTVEDHRAALEAAGLRLEVELPPGAVWVTGDPTRLAQVLENLLTNARKFTDAGGWIAVRLTLEEAGRRARVTVRDSGIGIASEDLPNLFQPCFQVERSLERNWGGLGLGLTLVKGLVELHGGGVKAESDGRGRGATFSFWLPVEAAVPPPLPVASSGEQPVGRRRRVLIIEDNRDTAQSLKMLLEMFGHEVALAHTGRQGVEVATRFRPEVVLCDLGLPEMDGLSVARALRSNPATASAWLIAISGYGQDEDRVRSEQAGFDWHLTKPVEPKQVLKRLAELPPQRGA